MYKYTLHIYIHIYICTYIYMYICTYIYTSYEKCSLRQAFPSLPSTPGEFTCRDRKVDIRLHTATGLPCADGVLGRAHLGQGDCP